MYNITMEFITCSQKKKIFDVLVHIRIQLAGQTFIKIKYYKPSTFVKSIKNISFILKVIID